MEPNPDGHDVAFFPPKALLCTDFRCFGPGIEITSAVLRDGVASISVKVGCTLDLITDRSSPRFLLNHSWSFGGH